MRQAIPNHRKNSWLLSYHKKTTIYTEDSIDTHCYKQGDTEQLSIWSTSTTHYSAYTR